MLSGVKPSTLENCFEASQVKIHGPFPLPVDVVNIQEVEGNIPDWIRVAHPTLQLELRTQFIHPANETVEGPVNEIEDGIMAAYLPNEADEPKADTPLAIPPPVTPHEALAHIEDYTRAPEA